MSKAAGNSNRVVRIVTLPYRALLKARDFYVKRITECGNPQVYTKPMFGGLGSASRSSSRSSVGGLPRSFSAQSYSSADSDDLRELIRANSSNNNMDITKAELEQFIQQHLRQQRQQAAASKGVPRSVSVGMARIDEEAESYDEDSVKGNRKSDHQKLAYPRSKSYAVNNSNKFAAVHV